MKTSCDKILLAHYVYYTYLQSVKNDDSIASETEQKWCRLKLCDIQPFQSVEVELQFGIDVEKN